MDSSFRGRFEFKMDPKGRLSLPPAFRQVLQDAPLPKQVGNADCQIVLTNSQYLGKPCLHAYSLAEWRKLERRIAQLSPLKAEVQAFQRFYLSAGQVIEVDAQNRFLVPQSLRKYAGLNSQVVLVGLGSKCEIWAADEWSQIHMQLANSFEQTMNAVALLEENQGEQDE